MVTAPAMAGTTKLALVKVKALMPLMPLVPGGPSTPGTFTVWTVGHGAQQEIGSAINFFMTCAGKQAKATLHRICHLRQAQPRNVKIRPRLG